MSTTTTATASANTNTRAELDLSRLLGRLQQTLLINPSASLRRSKLERNKVGANLEFARNLLSEIQAQPSHTTARAQQGNTHPRFAEQRATLQQLQDRLYELNQLAEDGTDAKGTWNEPIDSDDDDAEEDLLNRYAPAIDTASSSIDTGTDTRFLPTTPSDSAYAQATASPSSAAATLASTLRSRRGQAPPASSTTARESNAPHLAGITPFSPAPTSTPESTAAALMEHHESEQNALTGSLLTLATALKESTQAFADTLKASEPLLDQTAASMDKNVSGMEAAGRRMGLLRKTTEGRGWWARLSLYAYIAILWVVAILVAVLFPKLRL